jgi:hypothetical protein
MLKPLFYNLGWALALSIAVCPFGLSAASAGDASSRQATETPSNATKAASEPVKATETKAPAPSEKAMQASEQNAKAPAPATADAGKASQGFQSVKATGDIVRGVLAGGAVLLELNQPIDPEANPSIWLRRLDPEPSTEPKDEKMQIQGYPKPNQIVATVPSETEQGLYEINLKLSDKETAVLQRPQRLKVKGIGWIITIALLPLAALALILWLLLHYHRRVENTQRRTIWALLFLEPENQTYSLSRAQFVVWSLAIGWAYVFIFVARGIVENMWAFPPLAGFGMTFLISLATLVAAQATNVTKGPKGAGQFNPSPADLVVHGGVLALERVQQVLWTLTAVGMFLVIVYKQYALSAELPKVPEELLTLMGISSGGYLAGKFARKVGPIIDKVRATSGSVTLTIQGKQLSKDALVWVDGTRLEEKPAVLLTDPDRSEFARELQIKLPNAKIEDWLSQERTVIVVNSDAQQAEWQSEPTIEKTEIISGAENLAVARVTGSYLGDGTTWEISGDAQRTTDAPKRSPTDARSWEITIRFTGTATRRGQVTAITARGRRVTAEWSG